jgi:hypothetical protein
VVNINTQQVVPGRQFNDFFGDTVREPDRTSQGWVQV